MVILGGLELVAAGYLINKHSKNKKEKRRLEEEEEAALEEEEDRLQYQPSSHHQRHSYDRKYSHDQKHSHDGKHSHDRKHSRRRSPERPNYTPKPILVNGAPQYIPNTPAVNSAPSQAYPPTGWPAHWEQSRHPTPQQMNVPPTYAASVPNPPPQFDPKVQSHPGNYAASRGRSSTRHSEGAESSTRRERHHSALSTWPHVRFAVPGSKDRHSPPPEYEP